VRVLEPPRSGDGAIYLPPRDGPDTHSQHRSRLLPAIKADQNLKNVESRDFGVFEDLSSLTCRSCAPCE
jgi:hypothetical protein